jgi:hypothetical protein
MRSMYHIKALLVVIVIFLISVHSYAQRGINNSTTPPQTTNPQIKQDSATTEPVVRRNTFFSIFNGNPGRAALYSLVIPSGGQVYNKKWLKVPIALGIDGAAIGWVIHNKGKYKLYDGIFRDLLNGGKNEFFTSPADVNVLRKAYKSRVEYAWVYFGIAHLITVFDAFVDRHLMEFDIENDIVYNSPLNTANAFEIVSIKIPLSKPSRNPKPKFIYLAE